MHRTAASPRWRRLVVAACCAAVLLAGCSWDGTLPTPDPTDDPNRAAAELAAGLAKRDLTMVEFSGAAGSAVNAEFQPLVSGMARLKPSVNVAGVDVQGDAATVEPELHLDLSRGGHPLDVSEHRAVAAGGRSVAQQLGPRRLTPAAGREQPPQSASNQRSAR